MITLLNLKTKSAVATVQAETKLISQGPFDIPSLATYDPTFKKNFNKYVMPKSSCKIESKVTKFVWKSQNFVSKSSFIFALTG